MEAHRQAVACIAAAAATFRASGMPFRIAHGGTNSTRPRESGVQGSSAGTSRSALSGAAGVRGTLDLRALRSIISVDRASRTALVEPAVPMDALVAATLAEGLVPPVVMEFPGITCGGAFAGTGGESSSFRHGWWDEGVVGAVELVTGDGRVVNPGAVEGHGSGSVGKGDEEYDMLRRAVPGSLGTIAVTTLLRLRLVPAAKWVRATYTRTASVAEAVEKIRKESDVTADGARGDNIGGRLTEKGSSNVNGNDYVDGILFSRNHGAVVTGVMTDDDQGLHMQTFSRPRDPWFYQHVEGLTRKLAPGASVTELIPLPEYLFRYDRGGFWVGRAAFEYFGGLVPFNAFTRRVLDDFLHTRMLYRALHSAAGSGGMADRLVVQDLAVPYDKAEEFVEYTAREFGIWPLWLCPLLTGGKGPMFHPHIRGRMAADGGPPRAPMLNVGLWGLPTTSAGRTAAGVEQLNRDLECRLRDDFGGMKWLYAKTFYSEDEFWRVYAGREKYEALRRRFGAEHLPSVYDKVKKRSMTEKAGTSFWNRLMTTWPLPGLRAVRASIESRDYFLHRKKPWAKFVDYKA